MNEKTAEKTSLEIIRVHQRAARLVSMMRGLIRAQLREWFGPENVQYAKYRCGRARRWEISVGPDQSGRGGNERVRRIPGARSGQENCLHLEMG